MKINAHENQCLSSGDRVCIIGAGPSGLAAAKALKESGVPYDHYERSDGVGGLWRASSEHSPAYENLRLVTSKEHTAFSDYPMPKEVPTYGHRSDMQGYLEGYANAFGLTERIHFDSEVTAVEPGEEGGWTVRVDGTRSGQYGAVLVCSGHHWTPRCPSFSGHFAGEQMHARSYWSPESFKGQHVLVVGIGNSGAGIAVDLQGHAESVTLSARSGTWVIPKHLLGLPTDWWAGRYQTYLPFRVRSLVFRLLMFLTIGRQEKYGVPTPDHYPLQEHPTLSDELLPYAKEGAVKIRPGIEKLDGRKVYFADGLSEHFDRIIYATGYQISFPFLPDATLKRSESGALPLYRQVVHPDFPGLYFIGLVQPAGALPPLSERQAKWVAQLITGKSRLPSLETMHRNIQKAESKRRSRYYGSPRHSIEVDFWDYVLDLESEMSQA